MLSKYDKRILHEILKANLTYMLSFSRHANNKELMTWINEQASYEDILYAYTDNFLTESEEEAEADKEYKLRQAERQLGPVVQTSLALLIGGPVARVAGKAAGMSASFGSFALGPVAAIGIGFGASLFMKVVTFMLLKITSSCTKTCRRRYPNTPDINSTAHKYILKVCILDCRLNGLKSLVSRFRSEIGRCSRTANPDKCKSGLYEQIGKRNEEIKSLEKKRISLQNKINKLTKKQAGTV